MSSPESGEHNDVHDIETIMRQMFDDLSKADIKVDRLFLNADAGFDCDKLWALLIEYGVIPNICITNEELKQTIFWWTVCCITSDIPLRGLMYGLTVSELCLIGLTRLHHLGKHGLLHFAYSS